MCCLPIALTKWFLVIITSATLIFWQFTPIKNLMLGNMPIELFFLGFIISSPLTFYAICGLFGALYKNKTLLTLFNIGNICCLILVTAIVFGFAIIGQSLLDDLKCGHGIKFIQEYDDLAKEAEKTLCKSQCKCYYTEPITGVQSKQILNYSSKDSSLPISYQQCQGSHQYSIMEYDLYQIFEYVESTLECAGVCQKSSIYLFSDINKGTPKLSCAEQLQYTVLINLPLFGIAILGIFGSILLLIICTCCICFHPDRKNKIKLE